MKGLPKRWRGRQRKYSPKSGDVFESTKYDSFFTVKNKAPEEGETIDIPSVVKEVFAFLYLGQNDDKLFSKPKSYTNNKILNNLVINAL